MASSAPGKSRVGVGELEQKLRHLQEPRIVIESGAKRLQAPQVIRDAEFRAQLLEDLPVALAMIRAERSFQPGAEPDRELVVVEERIVHVQQEHDLVCVQHGAEVSATGLCQVSSPSMILSASAGPQLP